MSKDCPCKTCTKHGVDLECHSKCSEFTAWKKIKDEIKAEADKKRAIINASNALTNARVRTLRALRNL